MRALERVAEMVRAAGAAALVRVIEVRGSAPREAGAFMVVRADGAFHGTIGGGELEWRALAAAREALARGRGPMRRIDQSLGPDLGQCCGGRVILHVETFDARDLPGLDALARAEGEIVCRLDEDGRVVREALPATSLPVGEGGRERSEGVGWGPGGESSPSVGPHPAFLAPLASPPSPTGRDDTWREPSSPAPTPLLLFGAGHVGRALALALAPLPFRLTWVDTRAEAFPAHVPASANPIHTDEPGLEIARAPAGAFVLVMTHSHPLDLALTASALAREDLPFVGLIGSATKRARFEKRFAEIGLPEARIEALVCPIGISGIQAKEPAVIAAATAAQLLSVREAVLSGGRR